MTEKEQRLLDALKMLCLSATSASFYVDHHDIVSGSLQSDIQEPEEIIEEYENEGEDV